MSEFTADEIRGAIEAYVKRKKKIPTTKDLADVLAGLPHTHIQPYILAYTKALPKMLVLPSGLVVGSDSSPVWYRNSAGSLTLARYKQDPALGNIVTG